MGVVSSEIAGSFSTLTQAYPFNFLNKSDSGFMSYFCEFNETSKLNVLNAL